MCYHNYIQPIEYADKPLMELARQIKPDAVAVAMFAMYNSKPEYVSLRDRTDEYRLMLCGLARNLDAEVIERTYTGTDLFQMASGFDVIGASFTKTFKLMVV